MKRKYKSYLTFLVEMDDISSYLSKTAFVQSFGHPIKVDDIGSTLAHKARMPSSWIAKKLIKDNNFFMACPSRKVVNMLIALSHIRGEGFTLLVNHWDQTRSTIPHNLKFKVSINLLNLSLIYWYLEAIVNIGFGFRTTFHVSRSCMQWNKLSSFDLSIIL